MKTSHEGRRENHEGIEKEIAALEARQVMRIQFTSNKKIRVIFYESSSRFRSMYGDQFALKLLASAPAH